VKKENTTKNRNAGGRVLLFPAALMVALAAGSSMGAELVFKDATLSFQTLRTMGAAPGGGADIGECLSTAYRIKAGSDESWYDQWHKTAVRLEKTADRFLAKGHRESAKEAYFRASNYYRTAEFFLHANPHDPRILKTWGKSRGLFIKAAGLSKTPIRPVEIPFEGTTLPGYLCLDGSGKKRPLIVAHSGFDGTAEELYFSLAFFAVRRGYHCLLFEGPGQGRVIREQKIPFRPNWETVVAPVVDFALRQPEVVPDKIALIGYSMGGYLAPRAVAYEPRIKACVANGGVYDFHAPQVKELGPEAEKMLDNPARAEEIDKEIYEAMKTDTGVRWFFNDGMWKFGAKTPSELLRKTRPYNMKDCAGKITCRMFIIDSEKDTLIPGQAGQLYDALKCPKDFHLFTAEQGAEEHCQVGASFLSNEIILNWLDETLQRDGAAR